MTFRQALSRLRGRDDWKEVLSYLTEEREAAIQDFHTTDNIDNQTKLARLAGEIAALDRVYQTLKDEPTKGSS